MIRRLPTPELGGATALILHRPHATVQALTRQLSAIGLRPAHDWPEPGAAALAADFVFFDADLCHDAMFPWPAGRAPMPLIALIGSEAPGRIEWALSAGADAQMLKPVGDGGVYSALLIARQSFETRRRLADEIAGLKARLAERQTVVKAVLLLAARGKTEAEAYDQLRALAMAWQVTIEEAARRIAEPPEAPEEGGADVRRR
ncbi:ANTAR domain-containing response regulator [Oceaniglobus roseus]|uniref:ANTAR domain-containing response regulator n=1 Tax=Oceaniglobus roseus TaxID=1737570 RepID=UPI000C7F1047|nr:ANTAR domain-containing protein [Kandeliimicrobium roseum]